MSGGKKDVEQRMATFAHTDRFAISIFLRFWSFSILLEHVGALKAGNRVLFRAINGARPGPGVMVYSRLT